MKIILKTFKNQFIFEFDKFNTIKLLKDYIFKEFNIPIKNQKLFINKNFLEDQNILLDYSNKKEIEINLKYLLL